MNPLTAHGSAMDGEDSSGKEVTGRSALAGPGLLFALFALIA